MHSSSNHIRALFSRLPTCYSRTPAIGSLHRKVETIPNIAEYDHTNSSGNDSVIFQTKNVALHKLEAGPSTSVELAKLDAERSYRQMKVIREMAYSIDDLYSTREMPGPAHSCMGQEACSVGISSALRPNDSIMTAYRLHGWAYVKGISVHKIIAELLGRQTGGSKGKGGSMHLYNISSHFYGGHGIVGAQVPLGVGIALAQRNINKDSICVTVYGDGAANQGQVFEAFNIAKLWNLPVLFVCENNKKSRQAVTQRHSAAKNHYSRVDYIPGIGVDGMDVLAVIGATRWAVDFIRSGLGPLVMEVDVSYFNGHIAGQMTTDVTTTKKVQIRNAVHDRDPISIFRKKLTTTGLLSEQELQNIDDEVIQEIEDAVEKATNDPDPCLDEMYTDIYKKTDSCISSPQMVIRGCDVLSSYDNTR